MTIVEFVWSRVLRITDPNRWFKPPFEQFVSKIATAKNAFNQLKLVGLSLAIFAGSFSNLSYQDTQSLVDQKNRWLMHIPQSAGRSVASASMSTLDSTVTHAVRFDHLDTQQLNRITHQIPKSPKPQRINRKLKGDRVVSSNIIRPPAHFSAGTVLRRHSFLSPLDSSKNQSLAFVKPKSSTEVIRIASAFHVKQDARKKRFEGLPVIVASLVRESESSVLSYSQEPEVEYSPFAAVLRKDGPISIIPKLNKYDHDWADDPLPKTSFSKKQQQCLATGIYFESRGESARGQAAVAQVILNRVRNPTYPNTICSVVFQNKHRINSCQFSFACDRKRDRVHNKRLWKLAQQIATETTAGRIWLDGVGSSTHYHATYVRPKWARTMKKVGKIGLHIFYRTRNGGWS